MNKKKEYLKHQKFIRERVKKYSQKTSFIFWIGILNLVSFIYLLIDTSKTYSLGLGINVLIYGFIYKSSLDAVLKIVLNFFACLFPSVLFMIMSILSRKGKSKPLIISFVIYIFDTLLLFFIPSSFYLLNEKSSFYNQLTCYILHAIIIGYFIYLFILYNKICKDSIINKQEKQ